eukprot:11555102-Prorocentrum_lima.AAC.1
MPSPDHDSSSRAKFMSMRAHFVHDLVKGQLLRVHYVASRDNPADALAKGLRATTHKKARLLLCVTEQE